MLKAQDGDEDAIRELGVSRTPPKLVDRSPSLMWLTLKFDFIEIVAINFHHNTTFKNLVYVANFKFKMKIRVTPTVDKVLDNCAEMVASWQRFLAKIGNKNGERVMGQLHSIIADCRNGDQDAITFVRLDEDYAQTSVDEIEKVPHSTFVGLSRFYVDECRWKKYGPIVL